ncbi:MAG: cellulose biosynthesis cyclic di-GMP-binding regulatory protein BcsB [Clostridium beijerinckii]|nr:cellulose biosynthesis cyclic di-GMP-binding regulatory protein BcsB [Clostridium beijerinckii]
MKGYISNKVMRHNEKHIFGVLFFFVCIIFSTAILIFNTGVEVFAASEGNNIETTESIKTYSLSNDISVNGTFSSHSIYFNVDKWWENTKAEVQVNFSINQLIDNSKNSYIKLSVNGTPFYSQKVYYRADSEVQQLTVSIPKELIKTGSSELKIEAYLRSSEDPCVDDVNSANWFVIKDGTNIKTTFNNIISNNKISDFPYPFLKNHDNDSDLEDLLIIIPDDYTDSELSAAYILNSYLQKVNDKYENKISITKYGDFQKGENTNNIFIGKLNSFPNEYTEENNQSDECLIKISNSLYSKNINIKNMMILCNDDDNLIRGVKALENQELIFQLSSDTYKVNKDLKVETVPDTKSGKITFDNMGIGEIQLKGVFRREAGISYSIPKNKVFSQNDKLKIFMRYSDNLDFDKSLVTVYFNNTPIGSKKLDKSKALNDELEISLPNDISYTNYLDIKLGFDLILKDTYCEKREEDMPWALVTRDSYLYIGDNDTEGYYFSSYSAPFVKDEMFNDTAMIVPDSLSSKEMNSLGKVIGFLGKDVAYNNGDFKAISNSNVTADDKKKNIIIYGTPKTNKLISEINDKLWFKYDESYSKFLSNEKLQLTEPFSYKIANFQFDISKYNSQKAMLVLTSPDNKVLEDSLDYLSVMEMFQKLNGDCAIIDEEGNIKTYKMKKETTKPVYERVEALGGNAKIMLIIIGLFIIFAVIAIVLYLYKNKSKDKSDKGKIGSRRRRYNKK